MPQIGVIQPNAMAAPHQYHHFTNMTYQSYPISSQPHHSQHLPVFRPEVMGQEMVDVAMKRRPSVSPSPDHLSAIHSPGNDMNCVNGQQMTGGQKTAYYFQAAYVSPYSSHKKKKFKPSESL